jgi:hypothetical protein
VTTSNEWLSGVPAAARTLEEQKWLDDAIRLRRQRGITLIPEPEPARPAGGSELSEGPLERALRGGRQTPQQAAGITPTPWTGSLPQRERDLNLAAQGRIDTRIHQPRPEVLAEQDEMQRVKDMIAEHPASLLHEKSTAPFGATGPYALKTWGGSALEISDAITEIAGPKIVDAGLRTYQDITGVDIRQLEALWKRYQGDQPLEEFAAENPESYKIFRAWMSGDIPASAAVENLSKLLNERPIGEIIAMSIIGPEDAVLGVGGLAYKGAKIVMAGRKIKPGFASTQGLFRQTAEEAADLLGGVRQPLSGSELVGEKLARTAAELADPRLATGTAPMTPVQLAVASTEAVANERNLRELATFYDKVAIVTGRGGTIKAADPLPGFYAPSPARKQLIIWKQPKKVATPPLPERVDDWITALEAATTNEFAYSYRAAGDLARVSGVKKFGPEAESRLLMQLLGGATSAGQTRADETYKEMLGILGKDIDLDFVNEYLQFNHAVAVTHMAGERRGEFTYRLVAGGLQAGVSGAFRSVDSLRELVGPDVYVRVQAAGQLVVNHYRDLLADKVAAGLIDPDLAVWLRKNYPHYNPIAYLDDLVEESASLMKGYGRETSTGEAYTPARSYEAKRKDSFIGITVNKNDLERLGVIGARTIQEKPLDGLVRATVQAEILIGRNKAAKAVVDTLDKLADLRVKGYEDVRQLQVGRKEGERTLEQLDSAIAAAKARIEEITGLLTAPRFDPSATGIPGVARLRGAAEADSVQQRLMRERSALTDSVEELGQERATAVRLRDAPFQENPVRGMGTISMFRNGQREVWQVPQKIADEARMLGRFELGNFGAFLQAVQAPFRAVITGANPVFGMTNLGIDTVTAWLSHGTTPLKTTKALVNEVLHWSEGSDDLIKLRLALGDVSGLSGPSPQSVIRKIARAEEEGSGLLLLDGGKPADVLGKALNVAAMPVNFLYKLNHIIETAPRIATMQTQLERGASLAEAALAARQVTVDFAQAGTVTRLLSNGYLYLNPAVQGAVLPFRAIARDPVAVSMRVMGYVALHAGAYIWNRQFAAYNDLPLHEKFGSLVVMLPTNETDQYGNPVPLRITIIPDSREWASFTAPLTLLYQHLDKKSPDELMTFLSTVTGMLNPLNRFTGEGGVVPTQALSMVVEQQLGFDLFRQRDIVPERYKLLPVEHQFDPSVPETIRRLGQALHISPFVLQHYVRSFGGLGQLMLSGIDGMLRSTNPEPIDPLLEQTHDRLQRVMDASDDPNVARKGFYRDLDPVMAGKLRLRELHHEPGFPVIEQFVNKYYRSYGGQLRRTSEAIVAKEMGVSVEQTQNMQTAIRDATETRKFWIDSADSYLNDGVGPAGKPFGPREWREAYSKAGESMRVAIAMLQEKPMYANAAQNLLDPEAFLRYQALVYTASGLVDDPRSRGEILAAGLAAIQPETVRGFMVNPDDFYKRTQAFVNDLSPDDRSALRNYQAASQTPNQERYLAALDIIRPYFEAEQVAIDAVLAQTGADPGYFRGLIARYRGVEAQLSSEAGEWLKELEAETPFYFEVLDSLISRRVKMTDRHGNIVKEGGAKNVHRLDDFEETGWEVDVPAGMLAAARLKTRLDNPELDLELFIWGFSDITVHPDNVDAERAIKVKRYKTMEEVIPLE